MKLSSTPVNLLLEAFRSPAPTPGGGSAAALAGALGASLLAMVAALPKPRSTAAADLENLAKAGRSAESIARSLETLIDRDADAYDMVVAAYRLAKGTDEEKALRSTHIRYALKAATQVPLDVMRLCHRALSDGIVVLELGNPSASSDANVGMELLRAGMKGAKLNIEINLQSLKDEEYVTLVRAEVDGFEH